MAAEVTVVFRDDKANAEDEDYILWLTGVLEDSWEGITVMNIEMEEV